jgi:hypothetical protein
VIQRKRHERKLNTTNENGARSARPQKASKLLTLPLTKEARKVMERKQEMIDEAAAETYHMAMKTDQTPCTICSELADKESAFQKYGWEENDSYLPAAASKLTIVRDFKPHSSRKLQLQQCPECGTFYLYRSDYEYLVNGSEDEEYLTRLSDEETAEYLKE